MNEDYTIGNRAAGALAVGVLGWFSFPMGVNYFTEMPPNVWNETAPYWYALGLGLGALFGWYLFPIKRRDLDM